MKSAYQIIRRPVITEKGLAIKENQNTLVFQVASKATKTEIKEAVQSVFKVKVDSVRTANYPGKERRRGKFAGYRPEDRKSTRLNSSHVRISYAVFCLKKKKKKVHAEPDVRIKHRSAGHASLSV